MNHIYDLAVPMRGGKKNPSSALRTAVSADPQARPWLPSIDRDSGNSVRVFVVVLAGHLHFSGAGASFGSPREDRP